MELKVKYLADIPNLIYIGGKSDWIDLYAAEDVVLKAGDHKLIPLGVAIKLPEGYEALVAPRSSTFKNWGIIQVNSPGVIDESYCGDEDQWYMSVYATRDIIVPKHARVCQFRIIEHQPRLEIVGVESIGNVNRGGIGTTGIY